MEYLLDHTTLFRLTILLLKFLSWAVTLGWAFDPFPSVWTVYH